MISRSEISVNRPVQSVLGCRQGLWVEPARTHHQKFAASPPKCLFEPHSLQMADYSVKKLILHWNLIPDNSSALRIRMATADCFKLQTQFASALREI